MDVPSPLFSRLSRLRALFKAAPSPSAPLPFQLLGRILLHSALVGAAAGLVGSAFFGALELLQDVALVRLSGYIPLTAAGEHTPNALEAPSFRPWILWALPALGALLAGAGSALFAPETLGGGADAIIDSFHNKNANVRKRVPFVKVIVSILTLGSGGSGGREGPTMQIGGSIGALVGKTLRVTDRERRILLVAGTAAGMSAVFRTPLGAALLAVEVLHRDDFESDALVPSVLASVVSYSVFISFFGEATLFGHSRYPFVPGHLWLYAVMALLVCLVAIAFEKLLHATQRYFKGLRVPRWTKPALGGLTLGAFATPVLYFLGPFVGHRGNGLGILGGGYGAAQVAISGADWLPAGWWAVLLLFALALTKIVSTSLTVGSGGSAGDFGPSLVIGALAGGAFGRAAQLLLHDPRIDPGAFALVGMGVFYGGLAHVPIASLVMVCELAGSYDLLVPLMFAEGIAFVALRHVSLYHSQVPTKRESPAHKDDLVVDVLRSVRVGDVVVRDRDYVHFAPTTPAATVMQAVAGSAWQDAFPVKDAAGKLVGIVSSEILRTVAGDPDLESLAIAADLMGAPVSVRESEDLHTALELMLSHGARELLVTNDDAKIVGFLDEAEVVAVYHGRTKSEDRPEDPPPVSSLAARGTLRR